MLIFSLAPGSHLRVEMPVGELRVVGSNDSAVSVHLRVEVRRGGTDDVRDRVQIKFQPGGEARLDITGFDGMNNMFHKVEVHAEVRVPSRTHLHAELGVGELRVQNVSGDLRTHVGVGQITLEVPDIHRYRSVRANTGLGDIRHPFEGRTSGWIGKNFHSTSNQGEFMLDADVGVGEVRITEAHVI